MHRGFALVLIVTLCDLKVSAQQGVAIQGTVFEAGSDIPVVGAKVVLRYAISPQALDSVVTAASGTFGFVAKEPGTYAIEATAPGYQETIYDAAGAGIQVGDAAFDPGSVSTVPPVMLKLSRWGTLTGVVRDADTKKPMPSMTARAFRLFWSRGVRMSAEERIDITDDDGVFRFESLPGGEYFVELQNLTRYVSGGENPAKVYPIAFSPQNDSDTAPGVIVSPGTVFDMGTIDYSKVTPSRISGIIAAACSDQSPVGIYQRVFGTLLERNHLERGRAPDVCGKQFSIPSLSPGDYRLLIMSVGKDLLIGTEDVRVDEGAEMNLELKPLESAQISGRIVCDCESQLTTDKRVSLLIAPLDRNGVAQKLDVRDDGGFTGPAAVVGPAHVDIDVPRGYFLKRTMYNGAASGGLIDVRPGSLASLEIALSDKPAVVTGSARRDDKPALADHVVIAEWPLHEMNGYADFKSAAVDANENFAIQDLAPGVYRVVSVGPSEWLRKEMPNVVADWLSSADEITLGEKETRTIGVESKLP